MSPHWPSFLHSAVRLAQQTLYISVRYTGPPHTDWPSHWRALPQASFLSRQKYVFVETNIILSRQNLCRDKLTFVATDTCLSRQIFVAASILLSRQKKNKKKKKKLFCREKQVFVATNTCLSRQNFCREKIILVAAPANDRPRTRWSF